jgi:hypothetical protein
MAQWVTGAEILAQAGNRAPTPADSEWADAVAAAVSAGFDHRLDGAVYVSPPPPPELTVAALSAGVEAYKRKEAPFGLTGYVDLQGAAVRVARDYLDAVQPILARYATFGLG